MSATAERGSPEALLAGLDKDGLLRRLAPLDDGGGPVVRRGGRELVNFASNDYLGLSRHPRVVDAMIDGARRFGAGAGASRLVCGGQPPHHALEEALADAKGGEAALVFSSGYAVAAGCIPVIVGRGDTVILDKLSHACLVDAARASGATVRVIPHNRMDSLEGLLVKSRKRAPDGRVLVVTESLFSMDGDVCPLEEIAGLCERHGAMLWLDEAHATGVLGPQGGGLARMPGAAGRVDFQMGTLGKALGVAGGFLVASRAWIDLMVNRARAFVYSTAPPAAMAHAALEALAISRSAEGDAMRDRLRSHLRALGVPDHPGAIVPLVLGSNRAVLAASASLEEAGLMVPAIRHPTVPRGTARLRVSLSAAHEPAAVQRLRAALDEIKSGLAKGSRENP